MRGIVTFKSLGPGVERTVFPTDWVATQVVPDDGEYRFTLLPGPYILVLPGLDAPGDTLYAMVSVVAGQIISTDVPTLCP